MYKTHVIFLLDASGSMGPHKPEVISTFGEFVHSTKDVAKYYTVYHFDSRGVERLSMKSAEPNIDKYFESKGGMTPLYDAISEVVHMHEDCKDPVQLVIHTDGFDNWSKEMSRSAADALLAEMQESKNWMVTFLGEGLGKAVVDEFKAGIKLNLDAATRSHTLSAAANATTLYAKCGSVLADDYQHIVDTIA